MLLHVVKHATAPFFFTISNIVFRCIRLFQGKGREDLVPDLQEVVAGTVAFAMEVYGNDGLDTWSRAVNSSPSLRRKWRLTS
ncbi:hypothetical protein [Selenomonas ruminantium]|uniref:hypothetical protein n=1 Tax=Selenomonas ruminantium TaxID=971 RepID=UPI0013157E15|nr:hypothetical protein [Selenomonas ruminantium]